MRALGLDSWFETQTSGKLWWPCLVTAKVRNFFTKPMSSFQERLCFMQLGKKNITELVVVDFIKNIIQPVYPQHFSLVTYECTIHNVYDPCHPWFIGSATVHRLCAIDHTA
jgi:hypothetical protein